MLSITYDFLNKYDISSLNVGSYFLLGGGVSRYLLRGRSGQ